MGDIKWEGETASAQPGPCFKVVHGTGIKRPLLRIACQHGAKHPTSEDAVVSSWAMKFASCCTACIASYIRWRGGRGGGQ